MVDQVYREATAVQIALGAEADRHLRPAAKV